MKIRAGARTGKMRITSGRQAPLTIGVEEEFLLVDPVTGAPAPVAAEVLAALPDTFADRATLEFRPSMIELVTPVCTTLDELSGYLVQARQTVAAAAERAGVRLMASGLSPVRDTVRVAPANPRYQEMTARYGAVAAEPAVCGCHVHVGVPDRDTAVRVCAHLRPWLPLIQAIAANSPIQNGADTGHASWRSVQQLWPSLGPTPAFTSAREYDTTVAALTATGAMLDESMVYWYARLSAKYPTVEVRVTDVCPTAAEAVVVTALIRGLVATAIDDVRAGIPPLDVADCVLKAAHWRAAHDGVDGSLVDLRTGKLRPGWDLVGDLLAKIGPALDRHGDTARVTAGLNWLRAHRCGATRQRDVLRRTGDVLAVVSDLIEQTAGGRPPQLASAAGAATTLHP